MNRKKILIWGLALLPLLIVVFFYQHLPNQIPVHWSVDGSVRYGSKINLWLTGSMGVLFALLFPLLRKIDPKRKNYENFNKYYEELQISMMLFFIALTAIIVSESINPDRINVERVIVLLLGALFVAIGSMMPKFKNNFFVGIKTPWTIMDDEVWNKTHQMAGILWIFGGLMIMAAALILSGTPLFSTVVGVAMIISLVPVVMSYVWYKQKNKGDHHVV